MSIPKNNLGEYLKKLRESKGLSLNDIADITKVNLNILKNLENNNTSTLPNSTYVKGFIKNYCKACKSEFDYAISLWEQSQNIRTESPVNESPPSDKSPKAIKGPNPTERDEVPQNIGKNIKFIFNQKKYINSILVALIIGVVGYKSYNFFVTINQNSIPEQSDKEQVEEPIEEKQTFESVNNETTNQPEKTEQSSSIDDPNQAVAQKDQETAPDTDSNKTATKEEVPASETEASKTVINESQEDNNEEKETFPEIAFYPIGANSYTASKDSPELQDPDLLPKGKKALFREGVEQVFINAIYGDTWLTYKIDDKKIKSYNLKQGKSLFLSGQEVLLLIGNFKSVVFFYNNQFIKSNTKSNVKVFVFPKSKSAEYKIPLFPADNNGKLYTSKEYEELTNN